MADIFKGGKGKGKGKGKRHPLLIPALLAVAAAGGIWLYTQNKKSKQGTLTATPTTQATGGAYSTSPAVGTLASQVPQFVNQTYVNPTPPSVTQTTNITQPPPRPVHITVTGEDEDHRNKHRFGHGPQPPTPGPGGHGTPGPRPVRLPPTPGPGGHGTPGPRIPAKA